MNSFYFNLMKFHEIIIFVLYEDINNVCNESIELILHRLKMIIAFSYHIVY